MNAANLKLWRLSVLFDDIFFATWRTCCFFLSPEKETKRARWRKDSEGTIYPASTKDEHPVIVPDTRLLMCPNERNALVQCVSLRPPARVEICFCLLSKLGFISMMRERRFRIPCTARVPTSRCGCRSTHKGAMRRLCRGLLPLQAEIQAILCNRSRPALQPRDQLPRGRRGSGGKHFFASPPAALRRFRRAKAAPCWKSILHGRKCIST